MEIVCEMITETHYSFNKFLSTSCALPFSHGIPRTQDKTWALARLWVLRQKTPIITLRYKFRLYLWHHVSINDLLEVYNELNRDFLRIFAWKTYTPYRYKCMNFNMPLTTYLFLHCKTIISMLVKIRY